MSDCMSLSSDHRQLAKKLDAIKLRDGEQNCVVENLALHDELRQARNNSELLLGENKRLKSSQQELCGQMETLKETNEGLRKQLRESVGVVAVAAATVGSSGKHCQRCDNIDRELKKLKSVNDEVCLRV